ncbi:MAG: hypothetical protein COX51_05450 [Syntrophobacteraceae bacterium CG23_combo_of_CG06-09_8_20_14_all_50_8]|nr:MAG: hypothetical protein COX51_05450 [Syntrophobacteraceae bacterium CG23_combo_of_CG06-09_8_20_14_all_50_8]
MQAERGAKGFSCGDQFVAMLFASWDKPIRYERFYEKIFYQLLGKCRQLDFGKHRFQFKNKLFSLDATVIELCASLSDWARFRQTKGAVKLHLLLDHDGYLPVFAHITDGKVHEVKVAQAMTFPPGSIVVIDKGYIDYELFWKWSEGGVFFVTRQKDNARYQVLEEKPIPRNRNIISDQLIELEGFYSHRKYPSPLRRLEVWDEENKSKKRNTRLSFSLMGC